MKKQMILVVEDDLHISELLSYNLEANGFDVKTAQTVQEAYNQIKQNTFEAILLDIMLPDQDGITTLKHLRAQEKTADTPIIMVTAKSEEIDKIVGLELGADDYMTKPFSIRELIARIHAVLRRQKRQEVAGDKESHHEKETIQFQNLIMDIKSYQVYYKQQLIELTHKEFELLKILMQHPNKVFTRDTLLDQIWGYDYYGETRTVDVHIRYLRSKLAKYGLEQAIETVRGVGYRFAKE